VPCVGNLLERSNAIIGITLLKSNVFVLRCVPADHVEVYSVFNDGREFKLVRKFTVPGLDVSAMADMVACPNNRCLYLTDDFKDLVYRVSLRDSKITNWPVGDKPRSLSVCLTDCSVLVTCREKCTLKVFNTHGEQQGTTINLKDLLSGPEFRNVSLCHAIQLSKNCFLISHGLKPTDFYHQVCKVEIDEHEEPKFVCWYGEQRGSGPGQLFWPSHLAVDADESVYVADHSNGRVIHLLSYLGSHYIVILCALYRVLQNGICIRCKNH